MNDGKNFKVLFFDLLLKRSFLDRVVDLLKGKTIPHTSAMHQNNVVTQKDSRKWKFYETKYAIFVYYFVSMDASV